MYRPVMSFAIAFCIFLVPYACMQLQHNAAAAAGEEYIGFPENVEDILKLPTDNRSALFMSKLCGENEWYYPGDTEGDYICDCKPGYLYHAVDEKCYGAYERGPCRRNEIVILAANGFSLDCQYDRCAQFGNVTFGNKCVKLDQPCDPDTRRVYGVNSITLKLECLQVPRIYNSNSKPTPAPRALPLPLEVPKINDHLCPRGCKRSLEHKCPETHN